MIIAGLFVVLVLGVVSFFIIRTIWQQLGGEPEYAQEIASAVASGDLTMRIDVEPGDNQQLVSGSQRNADTLAKHGLRDQNFS